jgi:hypothetical protein
VQPLGVERRRTGDRGGDFRSWAEAWLTLFDLDPNPAYVGRRRIC